MKKEPQSRVNFWLTIALQDRLRDAKKLTGQPIVVFVIRAIEKALEELEHGK